MHSISPSPANPSTIGLVHFVGIGGIGMSGIAEIMHDLGYQIQGSDISVNANVKRLQNMGIEIMPTHAAANIDKAALLVISSAIQPDNIEIKTAHEKNIPIVRRAEMLAELMRLKQTLTIAGTHGKTTTTSMVAAILDEGGLDPTIISGGIINAYGTNARLGTGDWMVVEADESDGTFTHLPSSMGVVTNIDAEHLDHYNGFEGLKSAFYSYVTNIPFYGVAIMCIDHPQVCALTARVRNRRIISYGLSPEAQVRAVNIKTSLVDHKGDHKGDHKTKTDMSNKHMSNKHMSNKHRPNKQITHFDVQFTQDHKQTEIILQNCQLPMPGQHNLQNALAAIAVGLELGVSGEAIIHALAHFKGVKRRFTHTGHFQGIDIYDDYAHHPVEIAATLKSARQIAKGRVIAIMQPHRYSRLRDLFDEFSACFKQADCIIIAPVFAAGEKPIDGFNAASLVANIGKQTSSRVIELNDPATL
ncbi:MAG: UDP-N-acetylmuramate--L-alanine ligase, partial [Alphaproteobacteria bacterium]|nr:UDP-N-acetylmuramate--L-alanine ligase [Alphaproteobacteria bacterium]